MDCFSDIDLNRDYFLADWKIEKIVKQVRDFEKSLDSDHEIGLRLIPIGSSLPMFVESVSFQNPDLVYFYGTVDGRPAQLIQHMSQLNILLTSVEKIDKTLPARKIGFEFKSET